MMPTRGVSGTTDRSRTICPLPSHSLFAVLPRRVGFDERRSWVLGLIVENLSRESVPCLTSFKRIDGQHMELPHGRNLLKAHSHKLATWLAEDGSLVFREETF